MSLAAVHATKKQLSISESVYRQLLATHGVASSKELDEAGHKSLIAAMYRTTRQQIASDRPREKDLGALV